ncbi:MAG: hypothetical protein KGL48_12255 [Sphingomonadales bacterium]|nr:hypothetical protein [Sphingomonadales bacterium]MDE2569618.1 hypothetical protein [Sphingomonadales bacterium]
MDLVPSVPDGGRSAVREVAAGAFRDWARAYAAFAADVRCEVRRDLSSFDFAHGWRGTEHRVLLRNPYTDIGITTQDGLAAVWIAVRVDRAFRLRCEWVDLAGDTGRWLDEVASTFDAITVRLGCVAHLPTVADRPWLKAA